MNNKPYKIQENRHDNWKNGDSHVQLIKVILGKNQKDHSVDHKIEEVVFVKNDEHFDAEQDDCEYQHNF